MLAYVESNGRSIIAYNERSQPISKMSDSDFQILGVGSDFFVVRDKHYVRTFDDGCKPIAKLSETDFDSAMVGVQTFTLNFGKVIVTFSPNCKELSKRRP